MSSNNLLLQMNKELPEYNNFMWLQGYSPLEILQSAHETMLGKHQQKIVFEVKSNGK